MRVSHGKRTRALSIQSGQLALVPPSVGPSVHDKLSASPSAMELDLAMAPASTVESSLGLMASIEAATATATKKGPVMAPVKVAVMAPVKVAAMASVAVAVASEESASGRRLTFWRFAFS